MHRYLLIPLFAVAFSTAIAQIEPNPKAFLDLVVSKTDLAPGECAVVRLSFIVYDDNRSPLHFHELKTQLYDSIIPKLSPKNAYIIPNTINSIEAKSERINSEGVSRYDIYQGGICPISAGTITVPPVTLNVGQRLVIIEDTTITSFSARGFALKTVADAGYDLARKDGPIATGTFSLIEILRKEEVSVGESFKYQMLIDGKGQSSLLFPSTVSSKEFDVNLQSSELKDYIDHDTLSAYKILKFEITPKPGTEGTYSMSSIFGPTMFFDPVSRSIRSLNPKKSIKVINKPGHEPATINLLPSDSKKTFAFLLDISTSMMIEDFTPTRMEFMKKQLSGLTTKGYSIEPIVFAALAKPLSTRTESHKVDEISHKMIPERGTSISDALMFTIQYIKTSGRNYSNKIFIAGDGDDTSSVVPMAVAAEYARANGFTIYTIGVGSSGPVPFGTDAYGNHHMVNNTFSDRDFKMIATKTGGRYVQIKVNSSVGELFKDVLSKP